MMVDSDGRFREPWFNHALIIQFNLIAINWKALRINEGEQKCVSVSGASLQMESFNYNVI